MYLLIIIDLDHIEIEEQIPDTNVSTIRRVINEYFDNWEDIASWWVEDEHGVKVNKIPTANLP